jgi:hypothetical protein
MLPSYGKTVPSFDNTQGAATIHTIALCQAEAVELQGTLRV